MNKLSILICKFFDLEVARLRPVATRILSRSRFQRDDDDFVRSLYRWLGRGVIVVAIDRGALVLFIWLDDGRDTAKNHQKAPVQKFSDGFTAENVLTLFRSVVN